MIREGKRVEFPPLVMNKVRELTARYPEDQKKSALLPVLHIAQEELGGYLTVDVMDYVAGLLGIQPIEVYEVASFYSMFYLEKVGKYVIEVCQTGPCAMCGGEEILAHLKQVLGILEGETTPDGLFTLRTVECLGGCGNAPNLQVNGEFHDHLTIASVDRLLTKLREKNEDENDNSWVGQYS